MTKNNLDTVPLRFFIGANTARGFVNYADDVFNGLRKLYILKGGPGTGKSTWMKRAADKAERAGFPVERYYCSSDSDSLDGIVIRDLGIGMTDGTAPHVREAVYPGAREELLDPGLAWDAERLEERLEEIKTLSDRKAALFTAVYRYLGAIAALRAEAEPCRLSCFDAEKAEAAAGRWIRRLGTGNGFSLVPRQIGSVGMNGRVVLDTYTALAGETWTVSDSRGLAGRILRLLIGSAGEAGLAVWISRDPFGEPEALYFPEKRVAVTVGQPSPGGADKIINAERFVKKEALAAVRGKLRFLARLEAEMGKRVGELFGEIRKTHFEIEAIYREAMDFQKLDRMINRFLSERIP